MPSTYDKVGGGHRLVIDTYRLVRPGVDNIELSSCRNETFPRHNGPAKTPTGPAYEKTPNKV